MLQFVQKYIINKRKGLINKRKPEEMVCYYIGVNRQAYPCPAALMSGRIGSHLWRDGINKSNNYP